MVPVLFFVWDSLEDSHCYHLYWILQSLRLYQAMAPTTLILLELSVILVFVVITKFYIVLNYRYFPVCKARGQTDDFYWVPTQGENMFLF